MKEIYEQLLQQLAKMTTEDVSAEWEELKDYNEIGPNVDEYIQSLAYMPVTIANVSEVYNKGNQEFNNEQWCMAA